MGYDSRVVKLILELLAQTTSLAVVSDFLKTKGLRSSASGWDALTEQRILPALKDGNMTQADLIELLRKVEEYGRQHVFLYQISKAKAKELMDREKITQILKARGMAGLLAAPKILDQPKDPAITDVRWDRDSESDEFVIKVVEAREYTEYLGQEAEKNGEFIKRYKLVQQRAVNLARLRADGLLELRIASHKNSSMYKDDVDALWGMLEDFLPKKEFHPISLSKAKERLWSEKAKLHTKIRFSDSLLRNEMGTVLKAATSSENSDLVDDAGASSSLDTFLQHDAYCDASNIWFKANGGGIPSRDIHVRLSGEVNEFAIPAHCSNHDYEHVLSEVRKLNS